MITQPRMLLLRRLSIRQPASWFLKIFATSSSQLLQLGLFQYHQHSFSDLFIPISSLWCAGSTTPVNYILFRKAPKFLKFAYGISFSCHSVMSKRLFALASLIISTVAVAVSERRATVCNGHAELCSRSYGNVTFLTCKKKSYRHIINAHLSAQHTIRSPSHGTQLHWLEPRRSI